MKKKISFLKRKDMVCWKNTFISTHLELLRIRSKVLCYLSTLTKTSKSDDLLS